MGKTNSSKLWVIVSAMFLCAVILVAVIIVVPYLNEKSQLAVSQPLVDQPVISQELGASLIYSEGAVEYKLADSSWQRAEIGAKLATGSEVEIIGIGKAIINFDDGSAVRLNSDSKIVLTSLEPSHVVLTNEQGEIYSRVVKADREFEVVCGEVIYQSLGTAYKTFNKEKEKGVEVYHSQVKVIDKDKIEVTVDEGEKYYEMKNDEPTKEKMILAMNSEDLVKDEFVVWNKTEDEKNFKDDLGVLAKEDKAEEEEKANEVEDTKITSTGAITLSAVKVASGIKLSWSVSGVDSSSGYKIVRSTQVNPVYPGNDYQYITNGDQHAYTWAITDGKTYNFRVCQYLGGKCGVYSNNVKLTAPVIVKETEPTTSGEVKSLTLVSLGGASVKWTVNGYSEQGYKVVWSKNSNPTYPTRSGDKYNYLSSPSAVSATVDAFDGAGTYYVRVCEYLGGKCGVYSNQITVDLGGASEDTAKVTSISLKATGGAGVSWTVNGYSQSGYKVVWSKNSSPTYPTRSEDKYNYYSDPKILSSTLDAFDGAGSYYVRVCEYLGGKCGVYSNQIQVTLE
jgi:hypothetical protein